MNRFAFLAFLVAYGTSHSAEPAPAAEPESASKLRPYIYCDGFAGGVRGVALDRRPRAAEPWREVGFGDKIRRVSVVAGYRVTYCYHMTFRLAHLKAAGAEA